MLKKKYLASNSIFCSISHTQDVLDRYFDILNDLFFNISRFEKNNENIQDILETDVCLGGIREKK